MKKCYITAVNSGRNILFLKKRGFFQNLFPKNTETEKALAKSLESSSCCMYCGFDPTSDSLHIGHLLPLMALLQCRRGGHQPIALIGGATALVGDPSGHCSDRVPLHNDIVQHNVTTIQDSLQAIFSNHDHYIETSGTQLHHKIKILNNIEWYKGTNLVDFLSKTGRYFRMGPMLNRHSVQSRLHSDEGMSFTEFSYQIFQAYDWLQLYNKYNCTIQIGGNDQTGNMMAGYELMGRLTDAHVYFLTVPLMTTEAGIKLGKTAGNALSLNPLKTTAFDLYQYFINLPDSDVDKYLRLFTFLSDEQIADVMHQQNSYPEQRPAQKKLAEQVTLLVHGEDGLQAALHWTKALIGRDIVSLHSLDQSDLLLLFKSAPCVDLPTQKEMTLLDLCMKAGCFNRIVDGERVIREGGVRVNHERMRHPDHVLTSQHILPTHITLIQIGKKSNFFVIRWH